MRRLLTFSIFVSLNLAATFAEDNGTGFIGDGYYRISNYATQRYIYVTDNKDYYNIGTDVGDFQAIQLWKDINRAVTDPASVILMKQMWTDHYDLMAQGTGVHALTGFYLYAEKQSNGTYEVSASVTKAGISVTKYLTDDEKSSSAQGKMGTNGKLNYKKWIVDKLETNHATNYFGIKPTIEWNGKYYQPFYADFPFKAVSEDMRIFYINQIDGDIALLQELKGEIPANTPVLIECASPDPSENRLDLLLSTSATVTGNMLSGVYFCNGKRPKASTDAYTKFNPSKMRVFSVVNGKLVLTKDAPDRLVQLKTVDWSTEEDIIVNCLPANTSYLKADSKTASKIVLTDDPTDINNIFASSKENTTEGVYTISGTQLRATNNVEGLPAGLYIVGGRKIAVK